MGLLGNGNMQQNSMFNQLMQFLNGIDNPQQFLKNQINNNPQMNAMFNQFKDGYGNKNPKELVFQIAKQNGLSEQQVMLIAHRLGLN